MKKLVKLLIPSVSVMLVAIMALTGATYAWFTESATGGVGEIAANVVEAKGIEVSWDPGSWGGSSTLVLEDENYQKTKDNTKITDFKFSPVSTSGSAYANGILKMYEATVKYNDSEKKNYIQSITPAIESVVGEDKNTTRGYIKYDLYFRLAEDPADGQTTIPVKLNKITVLGNNTNGTINDTIALASRVAIVNHGATDYAAEGAAGEARELKADSITLVAPESPAVGSIKVANVPEKTMIIYEPNYGTHTADGAFAENGNATNLLSNTPYEYYGVIKGADATNITQKDTTGGLLEKVNVCTEADDVVLQFKKGINKVTVYIWVEGQDADCTNNIQSTGLKMSVNFEKVEISED